MTDDRRQPRGVEQSIFVDEVGLQIGMYGDYRLRTSYQPIFRREGKNLIPFSFEARVAPLYEGTQQSAAEFLEAIPPSDRPFVEAVCRTIHIRNHGNIGVHDVGGFQLYVTVDPRLELQRLDTPAPASITALAEEAGMAVDMITCEILDAPSLRTRDLATLADEMRGHGVRISIAEFRVGKSAIDRVTRIKPDVIKIDGAWFRNVQDRSETARLFPAVITAFQGLGAKLLVQGIETPAELRAALDAGADYLQGMLLASPALAGVIVDEKPRAIASLIQQERKLVPFEGRQRKR